jgi:hypothetical protein
MRSLMLSQRMPLKAGYTLIHGHWMRKNMIIQYKSI